MQLEQHITYAHALRLNTCVISAVTTKRESTIVIVVVEVIKTKPLKVAVLS